MRVTASRVYSRPPPVPKMPTGLVELMEGLTRDVLKNNPPDVYEFCADHMRKLLEIRDGPSPNKKLTLEQKIVKAQEKVRKRAEQRWQKFKEEQNEKRMTEVVPDNNTIPSAVNTDVQQVAIKPVRHEDDLIQKSEVEISCKAGNNEAQEEHANVENVFSAVNTSDKLVSAANISDNVASATNIIDNVVSAAITMDNVVSAANISDSVSAANISDCVSAANITDNDLASELTSPLPNHEIPDQDGSSRMHEKQNDNNEHTIEVEPNLGIESHEKEKLQKPTFEKDHGDVVPEINSHQNEDTITKSEANLCEKDKENTNVEEDTSEQDSSNKLYVVENTKVQEDCVVQLKEIHSQSSIGIEDASVLPISDHKVEITKSSVDLSEEVNDDKSSMRIRDSIDVENVISRASTPENMITETNEFKNNDHEKVEYVNVTEATDISDNTTDLEKVLNEAIENSKRKDSSAYDSVKDGNVLNGEESDASESSNSGDKNITSSQPEQDKNNVFENKDAEIHSGEITLQNVSVVENTEKVTDIECKPRNGEENTESDTSSMNLIDENVHLPKFDDSDGKLGNDTTSEDSGETSKPDNANNGMDLETAAVTIQKVFRNFLFKSRASTFDDTINDENNMSDEEEKKDERQFLPTNMNIERRPLGISRMDTVLQTVNEEKSLSLSTDDSSLSSAATIIQSHVRGFLVRNKLHSSRTTASNSLAASNEPSRTSVDGDTDQNKNKTILNIHIVPEGGNYLSRDESMITSMDLSLDGSPPSSVNLHPLGYNTSERRKQLKREDAVQSVSPPSNNSGKLSEDVDSIKELTINGNDSNVVNGQDEKVTMASLLKDDSHLETDGVSLETTPTNSLTVETVLEDNKTSNTEILSSPDPEPSTETPDMNKKSLTKQSSDEMDVVTPFKENSFPKNDTQLLHSGEFHDAALPTKVSRSGTPVVSEFKNVLVYFIIWNN